MNRHLTLCLIFCITALIALQLAPAKAAPEAELKVITIRPPAMSDTKQGVTQFVGISGKTAGAKGLSMNRVVIPPGGHAKAHSHSGFESAIYVIKGRVKTLYGKNLEHEVINEAGDFIFMPPNLPHQPFNLSETEEAIAIVSRNDPSEQEHVMLLDEHKH